jgi:hypothetical protein
MPIDADLLSRARSAEARVIDAEHDADVARADFHRAVRRLQLAGGSLREIADALGLSHQRVHQIVEAAGGSRRWRWRGSPPPDLRTCSFCGRDQKHLRPYGGATGRARVLVAGPGVFICGSCVARAESAVSGSAAAAPPGAGIAAQPLPGSEDADIQPVGADQAAARCSFCGKQRRQAEGMASAGEARICAECLGLCREILTECPA